MRSFIPPRRFEKAQYEYRVLYDQLHPDEKQRLLKYSGMRGLSSLRWLYGKDCANTDKNHNKILKYIDYCHVLIRARVDTKN